MTSAERKDLAAKMFYEIRDADAPKSIKVALVIGTIHVDERGIDGELDCPFCDGTIRYSIASLNGHIAAKCSGDGCIHFMQ